REGGRQVLEEARIQVGARGDPGAQRVQPPDPRARAVDQGLGDRRRELRLDEYAGNATVGDASTQAAYPLGTRRYLRIHGKHSRRRQPVAVLEVPVAIVE